MLSLTINVVDFTAILQLEHIQSPIVLASSGPEINLTVFGYASSVIVSETDMCFGQIELLLLLPDHLIFSSIVVRDIDSCYLVVDVTYLLQPL